MGDGRFEHGFTPWNKGNHTRLNPKGEFKKGMTPWNKGKKGSQIAWNKGKTKDDTPVIGKMGFQKGRAPLNTGKTRFKTGSPGPWLGKHRPDMKGEKHPRWTGTSSEMTRIRMSLENKSWRIGVMERDRFMCQMPGCNQVERSLEAHHIQRFKEIITINGVRNYEEAVLCPALWDTRNGITLCESCHQKTKRHERDFEELFKQVVLTK